MEESSALPPVAVEAISDEETDGCHEEASDLFGPEPSDITVGCLDEQQQEILRTPSVKSLRLEASSPAKKARFDLVDLSDEPPRASTVGHAKAWSAGPLSPGLAMEALNLTDVQQFKYPWEKGRLACIFQPQSAISDPKLKLQPGQSNVVELNVHVSGSGGLVPSLDPVCNPLDSGLYTKAVKKAVGVTFAEERQARRGTAVKLWWNLIGKYPETHDSGRAALSEAKHDDFDQYGESVLDACFALKSPGTLLKRFYALNTYCDWLQTLGYADLLPFSEARAWSYLLHLKETKAPPTRSTSFMECLRFCHHVLSIEGADLASDSVRMQGLAAQLHSNKRPWRPADPLTVTEVLCLHKLLQDERRDLVDRIFVGHFLHMIYSRSRWSDLVACQELYIDDEASYLEVSSRWHKSSRSSDIRSKLLPIVAPALGIDGHNWVDAYMTLRDKANLSSPSKDPAPMLPAPEAGPGFQWSVRAVESREANVFLKDLCKALGFDVSVRRITTHSMKATCLSWCAKMGVPKEDREVLARHQSAIAGSTPLYRRDVISASLRKLSHVLEMIAAKQFEPDKTRSGMLTPAAATPFGCPGTPLPGSRAAAKEQPSTGTPVFPFSYPAPSESQPSPSVLNDDPSVTDFMDRSKVNAAKMEDDFDFKSWTLADSVGVIDIEEHLDEGNVRAMSFPDFDNLDVDELAPSEESTSEEDSSSSESSFAEPMPTVPLPQARVTEPGQFFINMTSLVLREVKTANSFKCGRKITASYCRARNIAGGSGMKCGKCFP